MIVSQKGLPTMEKLAELIFWLLLLFCYILHFRVLKPVHKRTTEVSNISLMAHSNHKISFTEWESSNYFSITQLFGISVTTVITYINDFKVVQSPWLMKSFLAKDKIAPRQEKSWDNRQPSYNNAKERQYTEKKSRMASNINQRSLRDHDYFACLLKVVFYFNTTFVSNET